MNSSSRGAPGWSAEVDDPGCPFELAACAARAGAGCGLGGGVCTFCAKDTPQQVTQAARKILRRFILPHYSRSQEADSLQPCQKSVQLRRQRGRVENHGSRARMMQFERSRVQEVSGKGQTFEV